MEGVSPSLGQRLRFFPRRVAASAVTTPKPGRAFDADDAAAPIIGFATADFRMDALGYFPTSFDCYPLWPLAELASAEQMLSLACRLFSQLGIDIDTSDWWFCMLVVRRPCPSAWPKYRRQTKKKKKRLNMPYNRSGNACPSPKSPALYPTGCPSVGSSCPSYP